MHAFLAFSFARDLFLIGYPFIDAAMRTHFMGTSDDGGTLLVGLLDVVLL